MDLSLRELLLAEGDPIRAEKEAAYLKSELPCMGVRVPLVRKIARDWARQRGFSEREDFWPTMLEMWNTAEYRDERKAVLGIVRDTRWRTWTRDLDALVPLRHFIESGAWWDLVDEAADAVGEALAVDERVATVLRDWSRDPNLWVRRTSIISQLSRKKETDEELLRYCIDGSVADKEFFAQKAIGWALRQYARTNPDWVLAQVEDLKLVGVARREALKHLA